MSGTTLWRRLWGTPRCGRACGTSICAVSHLSAQPGTLHRGKIRIQSTFEQPWTCLGLALSAGQSTAILVFYRMVAVREG